MKSRFEFRKWLTLLLIPMITALVLSGCGAPGMGLPENDEDESTSKTITGTAAAGLPIVGIVNVMGANGNTASADIDTDGNYTLDVTELTAPYILRATGTVNNESIELYSTGVAEGNINITPITNLITSKVIDGLDTAFDNWATESSTVNTAAIQAAEETVQEQLAPILEAYGITDDIDLMSVEFDTDHSGLDAVLDIVEIEIDDSNNVTITNTATGTTVTGDETFSDDEGTALVQIISETAAMNVFWNAFNTVVADGTITATEANSSLASLVADDFLAGGSTKTEQLDNFVTSSWPSGGIEFTLTISSPMESTEFSGSYTKGYWVNMNYKMEGQTGSFKSAMVYNGTNWLWYGDREWVNFWFRFGARKTIASDGSITYQAEWHMNIDDETNYAYDQGVRFALLRGPGLPHEVNGNYYLTLSHGYPDDEFSGGYASYTSDADAPVTGENPEYTVMLWETMNYSTTSPLKVSTVTIPGEPFLPSELTSSLFPTLTAPTSHDLSTVNFGGNITFSWSVPAGCVEDWARLDWGDGSSQLELRAEASALLGNTSYTFDTSSNNLTPTWADLNFECIDASGRIMAVQWEWR